VADDTNNAQANQQPPEPNPDLNNFGERLVGTWEMSGEVSGTVTYEWMEGGFFLIQRVDLEQYGQGVGGYHLLGEVLVIQQLQGEPLGVGEPVNDGGLEVLGELDPERSVPPFSMLSPSLK
jgi:hypothetical protein